MSTRFHESVEIHFFANNAKPGEPCPICGGGHTTVRDFWFFSEYEGQKGLCISCVERFVVRKFLLECLTKLASRFRGHDDPSKLFPFGVSSSDNPDIVTASAVVDIDKSFRRRGGQ